MYVSGFNKLSLVDFDGYVASTIFLSNCNFRCSFCHNSSLVLNKEDSIDFDLVLDYLRKRRGIIDAVCFTGGEPTLNKHLLEMIVKVKKMGFLVKLDTNGSNYNLMKYLLENNLVDYVAMDIKTDIDSYKEVIKTDFDNDSIINSINYLISSEYDYEFRTTLVKEYHNEDTIKKIALLCKNAKKFFLQKLVISDLCFDKTLNPVSFTEAENYKNILKKTIKNVNLRGYQ